MERGTTSKDEPHFQIAYLKKKSGKMSLLYQNQYTCSEDKMLGSFEMFSTLYIILNYL